MIYTLGFSPIIGQRPSFPLALINAPSFLPESLSRFLFEAHWFLWIALGLVGVILLVVALRGQQKFRPFALAVFAALTLWIILAYVVDTRYERLYATAQRILDATVKQDSDALLSELTEDFTFDDITKPAIGEKLRPALAALAISQNTITLFDETPGDPDTLVHLNILSKYQKDMNLPTNWELLFKEEPAGSFKLRSATGKMGVGNDQKLGFSSIPSF